MSKVDSFKVDHTTLRPGLYLRSVKKVGLLNKVLSWDLRFKAPVDNAPLAGSTAHTIEHLLAHFTRQTPIADQIVGVFTMGCLTGFSILTTTISEEKFKEGLLEAIDLIEKANIKSISDIPGASPEECGNWKFHHVQGALSALRNYKQVLLSK